ncbi:MAG: Tm-1-like ATP-binding domain-containing protein [Acidimicrobiia bacterium]
MGTNVVIVGTLDTKGPEVAYLADRLHALGCTTTIVDVGILGEPLTVVPDVTSDEVARAGGTTLEAIRVAGTRGRAVAAMGEAVRAKMTELFKVGKVDAAIGLGGAEGAVMGAGALMVLPIGVPKVVLSPIASGRHEFDPLVGTSDMMVVHTVVDILGLNPIATTVFDNVAAAVAGMARNGSRLPSPDGDSKYVGVTMLGNTTTAVMALRDRLAEDGYEAVVFHSNGVGGPAMEELAGTGLFVGVIDYTTNEVADPLVGGIHDGGQTRLSVVADLGIPQVVVPGCIDFSVFHSGAVPRSLANRKVYDHNPEYTLVRMSKDEMYELGRIFAERLGSANGPVQILIPTKGLSIPNVEGDVFWDPDADAAFRNSLVASLDGSIPVEMHSLHVNDPNCGVLAAEAFISLMNRSETTKQEAIDR